MVANKKQKSNDGKAMEIVEEPVEKIVEKAEKSI
jgi:hypothetical protein